MDTSATNIAARAGRWSAANWKKAFFGWLAFVALLFLLGRVTGTVPLADSETGSGEAARAETILAGADFKTPAEENVLVQSRSLTVADPAFRSAVGRVLTALSLLRDVTNVRSPLDPNARGQVSPDRHSALVQFDVRGKAKDAKDKVGPILAAIGNLERAQPGFTIEEFGLASSAKELQDTIAKDFQRAEYLTVPVTLLIMLFAFGALVAAGLPVFLAATAVLAALGFNSVISHVMHASDATKSVILLIGMAVGVDYSLFYLRREREERAAGRGERSALLVTAGTSGQAVLISGLTVLIAMAGMLLAGNSVFTSMGVGTMVVVFVAMVGSLSILPALLSKLGDRVDKGRIPFVSRLRRDSESSRLWSAVLRPVLRRPLVFAGAAAALLVALMVPAFSMHTKLLSFTDLPHNLPIVRAYADIQKAFPGAQTPAQVVVKATDVTALPVRTAIADLRGRALAGGQMSEPIRTFVNPDRSVARVEVPLQGNGDNAASVAALMTLRKTILPATLGKAPGVEDYAVTGLTAGTKDFNDQMKARAPVVFAFVLGFAFLLLLVTFRSLVIPLKAIVLNLLSVGASYGILVLVFQDGRFQSLLDYRSNGAVITWLPLFLFVVLFGLSMDYHVFILSRVKELVDRGLSTEEAVSRGIQRTAGTVTSAAVVMVAVFAIFASLRTLDIKQMGVGLAVAVLLDATIIRAVLLPATMKLLGDWNWYLPRWLAWLPEISHEGGAGQIEARPEPSAAAASRAS